jgi:hypothetical protein
VGADHLDDVGRLLDAFEALGRDQGHWDGFIVGWRS